ncbi:hypothetical protein UF64_07200 [Thalassospira sp. HJ]|nr:hypothetical protein UF64_07200 [Thalassospira sp. HJ]
MRKVMLASLAVNLFLVGAFAGTLVTGLPVFHNFMPPPPPPEFDNPTEPPSIRLLRAIRSRLSPEGKAIFDSEFDPVISKISERQNPRLLEAALKDVLADPNVTDAEIRKAYAELKNAVRNDLSVVLDHMANVTVKLSQEDREKMTLIRPPSPPPHTQ